MNNHNLTSPHGTLCHDGIHKSIILLVCMLLMACTGSDEPVISPDVISYQVETEGSHTRGAQATTSALASGFGVSAAVYPTAGTYTGYGCGSYFYNVSARPNTATGYYWPPADKEASFYAYYPYGNAALTLQSTANTLGVPTYAYTVPEAVASQVDVMTAQVTDHACGPQDALALTFGHRCADIRFTAYNQGGESLTVKSISIYGVKYTGTWSSGTAWTLTGSANSALSHPFTLSMNTAVASEATVDLTGTTNHFFMLPQTIAAGTDLLVITTTEGGEDQTYTYTLPTSTTWDMGTSYVYELTLGNGELIVSGVTIIDWEAPTPMNVNPTSQNWDHVTGTDVNPVNAGEWDFTTDLSMIDCAGNDNASGMTTANCYLVHEAGKYKLPLVYGNAIKNGAVNTVAFNPGTVSNGTDRFVNHANAGITGPWITKNGSGVDAGMNITVDGAQLIWQDAEDLVTDIEVNGDYLTFRVPSFAEGNAVIAAKSGSDIVWSWHIWVTAETLSNTTVIATGSHNYTVAPVNLGWIATGGDGKHGYSPYYQWGRKDPFVPCNGTTNDNTDKTVYVGSGIPAAGYTFESSTTVTIGTNIQYPWKHYYNSSTNGAVTTTYYNMWDAQNATTGNITTATKKTIYDPCPPGFCIPTGNLWYKMSGNSGDSSSSGTWDGTNKGRLWTDNTPNVYFPASGYRISSSGSLISVGSYGYYWSASPDSGDSGHSLYFGSSYWNWSNDYRAYGFPVRPVAEE